MISLESLLVYLKAGFKLVPLDEIGQAPVISWSEVYSNSEFWPIEKIEQYANKFHNVATTFGKTHLKDSQGRELFLYCLDIDSEEVLKQVIAFLRGWKLKSFVTKTQKDCGYHVYWFEYSSQNIPITIEDCKRGFEFEIKCGKALCTLPPSRHRDNPFFHYENVGQSDKIMIADGLYGRLVNDLLLDCLKKKKQVSKLKKGQKTLSNDDSTIITRSSHTLTPSTIHLESEEEQPIANCSSKLEHSLAASSESTSYGDIESLELLSI